MVGVVLTLVLEIAAPLPHFLTSSLHSGVVDKSHPLSPADRSLTLHDTHRTILGLVGFPLPAQNCTGSQEQHRIVWVQPTLKEASMAMLSLFQWKLK